MYLSDMRLSNVEISVAHAASSVTEIAPKSPDSCVNRSLAGMDFLLGH